MLASKTRSLNFNQTLEELLSTGRNNKAEQGGLATAARPPTRHGRESVSSSEENREPAAVSTETQKSIDAKNTEVMESNEEDDFLAKL